MARNLVHVEEALDEPLDPLDPAPGSPRPCARARGSRSPVASFFCISARLQPEQRERRAELVGRDGEELLADLVSACCASR